MMSLSDLILNLKGSSSSGNFGHEGRPGKRGGSGGGGGHSAIGIFPTDKKKLEKINDYRKGLSSKKHSISDHENSIRNAKIEHAAVYDKDGNKLFEVTGNENEVSFSSEQLERMKGGIVTHNHPPEVNGIQYSDGGSFSKSDAHLMLSRGLTEMRAVSTKYDYSLKPRIVRGINLSRGVAGSKYDLALEKARASANVDYRAGKLNKSNFPVEVTHRVWQDLADQGWVEYERSKI